MHHQSLWGPSDKSAEQMNFPTTTGDDMRSHLRTDSRMGSIRQIRRKNGFFLRNTGDDMRSHLRTDSCMGSIRQIRRTNGFFLRNTGDDMRSHLRTDSCMGGQSGGRPVFSDFLSGRRSRRKSWWPTVSSVYGIPHRWDLNFAILRAVVQLRSRVFQICRGLRQRVKFARALSCVLYRERHSFAKVEKADFGKNRP